MILYFWRAKIGPKSPLSQIWSPLILGPKSGPESSILESSIKKSVSCTYFYISECVTNDRKFEIKIDKTFYSLGNEDIYFLIGRRLLLTKIIEFLKYFNPTSFSPTVRVSLSTYCT